MLRQVCRIALLLVTLPLTQLLLAEQTGTQPASSQPSAGSADREQAEKWWVDRFDADKNGKLEGEEKVAYEQAVVRAQGQFRADLLRRAGQGQRWDINGDGTLTQEEARLMYEESQRVLNERGARWDSNRDGNLSQEENAAANLVAMTEHAKRRLAMDADGNGEVTDQECLAYWQKIRAGYDANHDGTLDAQERAQMRKGENLFGEVWCASGAWMDRLAPATAPKLEEQGPRPAPATRAATSTASAAGGSYQEAFGDLHAKLGTTYPGFALKGIDWQAVGRELLPRAASIQSDEEFGLLCMELVARMEDSHAVLGDAAAKVPTPPMPRFDPGLSCLIDDAGRPVVYYVDKDGPAGRAGVKVGSTIVSINGVTAGNALAARMAELKKYSGYSSARYLQYHAAQFLLRQNDKGAMVQLVIQDPAAGQRSLRLPAELDVRYLPRLPVPVPGIRDSGDVSCTKLPGNIGYIYVRRIRNELVASLDKAVGELADVRGLIIDVRGNSGGGFDSNVACANFDPSDNDQKRPHYRGPIALLLDERCISAGEGWASWFVAKKRARTFGTATAGASSRKEEYTLKNGLFKVVIPVKLYTGSLDRPIERRGLEPDVPLRQSAKDLANGKDTVLEAAKAFLLSQKQSSSTQDGHN